MRETPGGHPGLRISFAFGVPGPQNQEDWMANNRTKPTSASWRDTIDIHPAAELFPRLTEAELRTLGQDVVANGLTSPIVLWRPDERSPARLLDGISRLDAIELETGCPAEIGPPSLAAGEFLALDKVIVLDKSVDPYAYVISANIHRRHLTIEQKRELIAKLLKAEALAMKTEGSA
jgi:hypothetical protein